MTTHHVSRRAFLTGGLAAVFVVACGEGTQLLTSATAEETTSTTAPGSGINVMGEYTISDPTHGTEVSVRLDGAYRYITANGLPDHETGEFPNQGNPNAISSQSYSYRFPLGPLPDDRATAYNVPQSFGIAVNGVPFDPFAAEWYQRDRSSGWQYEATSGAVNLGLDANNAHVQPTGAYHYHGIPAGLVPTLSPAQHPPLVGWAGDGFPIYVRYGFEDPADPSSPIVDLASSHTVRSGTRPSGPGGAYDGTYVEDFEYVPGSGDLDESNGRFAVTPEYPNGIYAYFITSAFPVIPRTFAGPVDPSFEVRAP